MARTLYVRGERSAARGHTRSACDLYRECLDLTPRDSYAWLALCKVLQRTNATASEVRATFEQADACGSVHVAHAWARFEEDLGNVEEARYLYARALQLDPASAYVRHAWGLLERKRGHADRALEILEGGPDQRGLLAVAAAETRHAGDDNGLRDALLEVLGTSPSHFDAVAYRAFARVARSPGERCAALRRALESENSHICVSELADALADDAGDVDGARDVLQQFIERKHPDSKAYLYAARKLARLEHANGDLEKAKSWYDAALDGRETVPPVGVFLDAARCAGDRGDDAGARKLLTRATRAHRGKARPHVMLADLELRRQNYEDCEQCLARAVRADPSDGSAHVALGVSRLRRRDVAGARDAYRNGLKALKANANAYDRWAPSLWVAWATLEGDRGRYDEAASLLDAATRWLAKKRPRREDVAYVYHARGSLDLRRRRPRDAAAAFEAGLRLLPPSGTTGRRDRSASCLLLGLAKAKARLDDEDAVRRPHGVHARRAAARLTQRQERPFARRPALRDARGCFDAAAKADASHGECWRDWAAYELSQGASDDAASLLAAAVRAACVPASVDLACAHAEALLQKRKRTYLSVLAVDEDTREEDRERLQSARDVLEAALEWYARKIWRKQRPFSDANVLVWFEAALDGANDRLARKARDDAGELLARWAELEIKNAPAGGYAAQLAALALQAAPRSATALLASGAVCEAKRDFPGAARFFVEALDVRPDQGIMYSALARAQKATGDWGGARATLAQGVEHAPTFAPLWHEASELAAMVGDLDNLAELHTRALKLFPNGISRGRAVEEQSYGPPGWSQ